MKRTIINCAPIAFLQNSIRLPATKRKGLRSVKGFTLLEILTAIFILAVVVSMVFGTFDGIFSSAEHVNASSDLFEMGNACLDRITADIKAIHVMPYPRYKPPDIDDEPELYRIVGEPLAVGGINTARIRFASLAHLPLNQDGRDGIAEIIYYVMENRSGSLSLHRVDNLYPYPEFEPNPNDPVVCENLIAFELKYFDHNGDEYDEWDSESDSTEYNTPNAISIKLTLGSQEIPMVFSTRVAIPTFRYKPAEG